MYYSAGIFRDIGKFKNKGDSLRNSAASSPLSPTHRTANITFKLKHHLVKYKNEYNRCVIHLKLSILIKFRSAWSASRYYEYYFITSDY